MDENFCVSSIYSRKHNLLSRALNKRSASNCSQKSDKIVHVISDSDIEAAYPSEDEESDQKRNDAILNRLDEEWDTNKIYPIESVSNVQYQKATFKCDDEINGPVKFKPSTKYKSKIITDEGSIHSYIRNTKLKSHTSSSDFLVSISTKTSCSSNMPNLFIPNSLEESLNQLNAKHKTMTYKDRIMNWNISSDVSDIDDFEDKQINLNNKSYNSPRKYTRKIKSNRNNTDPVNNFTLIDSNTKNKNCSKTLKRKANLSGLTDCIQNNGEQNSVENIVMSINTKTRKMTSHIVNDINLKDIFDSSINSITSTNNFNGKKLDPEINKISKFIFSKNRQVEKKEFIRRSTRQSNQFLNTKEKVLHKSDTGQKMEFAKYLGLATTSLNNGSENGLKYKRRSLRVQKQQNSDDIKDNKKCNIPEKTQTKNIKKLNKNLINSDANSSGSNKSENDLNSSTSKSKKKSSAINKSQIKIKPSVLNKIKDKMTEMTSESDLNSCSSNKLQSEKNKSKTKGKSSVLNKSKAKVKSTASTKSKSEIYKSTLNKTKDEVNSSENDLNSCTSNKLQSEKIKFKTKEKSSVLNKSQFKAKSTMSTKCKSDIKTSTLNKTKDEVSKAENDLNSASLQKDYPSESSKIRRFCGPVLPENKIITANISSFVYKKPRLSLNKKFEISHRYDYTKPKTSNTLNGIKMNNKNLSDNSSDKVLIKVTIDENCVKKIENLERSCKIRNQGILNICKKPVVVIERYNYSPLRKIIEISSEKNENCENGNKAKSPVLKKENKRSNMKPIKYIRRSRTRLKRSNRILAIKNPRTKRKIILSMNSSSYYNSKNHQKKTQKNLKLKSKKIKYININKTLKSSQSENEQLIGPIDKLENKIPVPKVLDSQILIKENIPKLLNNPLENNNGVVLHAYYEKNILIVVQEKKITCWKCIEFIRVLGKTQNWEQLGICERKTNDYEVPAPFKNRICFNETNPVYIEIRAKQYPDDNSRECHLASVYVNVYFYNTNESIISHSSVQLDTIQGIIEDINFTTIPFSRYFIMCWKQEVPAGNIRTGICKYALAPNLDLLASIREFRAIRHVILQLDAFENEKLFGFGEMQVTIWNHITGDVIVNLDLGIPIGQNVGAKFYNAECTQYLLLYQIFYEDNQDKLPELIVFTVNLSRIPHTYRVCNKYILPSSFQQISSSIINNRYILVSTNNDEEFVLLFQNPIRLFFHDIKINQNTKRFYLANSKNIVQVSDESIYVKNIYEYLMDFER